MASEVADLIWNPAAPGDDEALLMVGRGSLAVVFAVAEECVGAHYSGAEPSADFLAAIADLRAALAPGTAAP